MWGLEVRTSRAPVGLPGAVCADREDVVGRDGGADRVLLHRGSREIEHLGSAHSGAQVELLSVAKERVHFPLPMPAD